MALIIYNEYHQKLNSIENFIDSLYQSNMMHLASDLLAKGVNKDDIKSAVKRAIISAKNAGLNIREHFHPVFTTKSGSSFTDCRMSKYGYILVLINCDPNSNFVTKFQLKIADNFIKK